MEKEFSDISVVWQKTGASPGNAAEILGVLRKQRLSGYFGRVSASPFVQVWSNSVFDKAMQGKAANYILPVLNGAKEFAPGYKILRNGNLKHPVVEGFKEALNGEKNGSPFVFSIFGGEVLARDEKDCLLCSVWSDLLGDLPIPVNFDERKSMFPGVFEEFGDRIEYYREKFIENENT